MTLSLPSSFLSCPSEMKEALMPVLLQNSHDISSLQLPTVPQNMWWIDGISHKIRAPSKNFLGPSVKA